MTSKKDIDPEHVMPETNLQTSHNERRAEVEQAFAAQEDSPQSGASEEHGQQEHGQTENGFSRGVHSAIDAEHEVMGLVQETLGDTVKLAGGVAGTGVTVIRDVAGGTLSAVEEVGGTAGRLATGAAIGAVGAIGQVGNAAVGTARDLLVGVAGGVRDVFGVVAQGKHNQGRQKQSSGAEQYYPPRH